MTEGLSAIINIHVESKKLGSVTERLAEMDEVVDLYEVTGESDIVALIKAQGIAEFRGFIKDEVSRIDGVRNAVSAVVLFTHKKDGVRIK